MKKILISACLLGENVRYNAEVFPLENEILKNWIFENKLIPFCPEVAGGLPVPRLPAEIVNSTSKGVLNGEGKVINSAGNDVSDNFIKGARLALEIAKKNNIKIAILKESSPSCGSNTIYDGTFSKSKKMGKGITTTLLEENGIKVFNENQVSEAYLYLKSLETQS
jgi:uncharacterized protein YbbK (DUF523 family)